MRSTVTLATLLTTLLLSACGGGDSGISGITLTDDTCTYEGDQTAPETQTFEAELANMSSKLGTFEIARIDEGGTFADVEAYVEMERQRLEDGLEIAGPPAFLTQGARAEVPAGETGMLVATVTQGEYVLWCAQEHPPTAVFLITPALGVTG